MFHVTQPSYKLLAKRLHDICQAESLQTDLRALLYLCELTDGDIRSCLNSLQFLKAHGQEFVSLEVLKHSDVGIKDMQKSLFRVWEGLFLMPSAKDRLRNSSACMSLLIDFIFILQVSDESNRYVDRLHQLISTQGEYNKIMQGKHHPYS